MLAPDRRDPVHVAIYTLLDASALRALWSLYDENSGLTRGDGIAQGSINSTYRLATEAGVFFLRINENKGREDVWYEAHLLDHLTAAKRDVVTPTIKNTLLGERFVCIKERAGRPVWAAIFPELPGQDLSGLEVAAAHTQQVGRFMAGAHHALRSFGGGRANPYGAVPVACWLEELVRCHATREVAERLLAVLALVRRRRRLLPCGVIHGDLFIDNTKWSNGTLAAVFDWEMAGRDHLVLDVVIAINAWCWRSSPTGSCAFDPPRCQALLEGYQQLRRLAPSERRGLYLEALLAAVRFTASRLRDFEVPRPGRDQVARAFLDYRDFLARLDALEGLGERGFLRMVGL